MTERCIRCNKELGFVKFKTTSGFLCKEDYHKFKEEQGQRKETTEQTAMIASVEKQEKQYQEELEAKRLFAFSDSEEDLIDGIEKSLDDVTRQERGSGIAKGLAMLSGNATDQLIIRMLKAMVDQNKIIIQQNELNRRYFKALTQKNVSET